jgi:hypothetical protein
MSVTHTNRRLRTVAGQQSWTITATHVAAHLTRLGGHLGPVTFRLVGARGDRVVRPMAIAPWSTERLPARIPNILRVLRGDFLCLPFGGNERPYRNERHSPHGETANRAWRCESISREQHRTTLHASLQTQVRRGRVDKWITLIDGQTAVYTRHVISMQGNMPLGHHAMLACPDREGAAFVSTSATLFGTTRADPLERPAERGYSALAAGVRFQTLERVPLANGGTTDASRYPARRGFEDLLMVVADPDLPFAWTAVTFPSEGYVWFALKNPRVLRQTVLWMSNRGRYYAPWNGRHVNVLGLEEVTGYFDYGLAESVRQNPLTADGVETSIRLRQDHPLDLRYVMAVCAIPRTYTHVRAITPTDGGVVLHDASGRQVTCPLDLDFVTTSDYSVSR